MGNLRLGVDTGATNTKAGIVDEKGEILAFTEWGSVPGSPPKQFIIHLIDSIEAFLEDNGELSPSLNFLGVAIAGWLDPSEGLVYFSPNLTDFKDVPLGKKLGEHFPYDVRVDNDTTTATWGEYLFGIDPKPNSLLGVFLGTGVGGGLVLNGRSWRGPNGSAGEIGHTTVEPDGDECLCGSTGCLEVYAGAEGIVKMYEELLNESGGVIESGTDVTPASIFAAGMNDDPNARAVYARMGRYLGVTLANAVDLLSIDAIVIGGKLSLARELFEEPMRMAFEKNILDPPNGVCEIHFSKLIDHSGILGAAFLGES